MALLLQMDNFCNAKTSLLADDMVYKINKTIIQLSLCLNHIHTLVKTNVPTICELCFHLCILKHLSCKLGYFKVLWLGEILIQTLQVEPLKKRNLQNNYIPDSK